jgi:hypothetical protein
VAATIRGDRVSASDAAEAAREIRTSVKSAWQVREALVIRAAKSGATAPARVLLEVALDYAEVPKTKRQSVDDALDTILGFGEIDDLVARHRA